MGFSAADDATADGPREERERGNELERPGPRLRWGSRMLLGETMHRAQSPNQFGRRNSYHAAAGKQPREGRGCDRIRRTVKGRHDDCAVRNIEVGVRCGQAGAAIYQRRWHGQGFDLKCCAPLVAHGTQAREVVLENPVVHVSGIFLEHGDDRIGSDKARQIVYMTIGIVARDSVAKPQDIGRSKVALQVVLDLLATEMWIAVAV